MLDPMWLHLQSFSTLTNLDASLCLNVHDKHINLVLEQCASLQSLNVRGCMNVFGSITSTITRLHHQIQELLTEYSSVSIHDMIPLVANPELQLQVVGANLTADMSNLSCEEWCDLTDLDTTTARTNTGVLGYLLTFNLTTRKRRIE